MYVHKNCAIACRKLRELCIDLILGLLSVSSGMRYQLYVCNSDVRIFRGEGMVIFVCVLFSVSTCRSRTRGQRHINEGRSWRALPHTQARKHARARARSHTHTHTHTHTHWLSESHQHEMRMAVVRALYWRKL